MGIEILADLWSISFCVEREYRMVTARWQGIRSVSRGVEVAIRTALLVGCGLSVLTVLDRIDLAAYSMFGAFCAAYGGNERYLTRARTVSTAGLLNLVALAAGVGLAYAHAPAWWRFVAFGAVMAVSVTVAYRYELIPAQPFFPAISLLVCAAIPVSGWQDAGLRVGIAAIMTLCSWVLSMAGWVPRRFVRPRRASRVGGTQGIVHTAILKDLRCSTTVRPLAPARKAIAMVVGMIIVAGAISELVAQAVGLERSYWALVTCASVMPVVGGVMSSKKAVERIVGTAVGVLVLTVVPALPLPVWIGVAVIVVAQFFTQLLVASYYAEALVFITILVFVSLSYSMPLSERDLLARLADTAVGSVVTIITLFVAVRMAPKSAEPNSLVVRPVSAISED